MNECSILCNARMLPNAIRYNFRRTVAQCPKHPISLAKQYMKSINFKTSYYTIYKTQQYPSCQTRYSATSQKPNCTISTSTCKESFVTTALLLWESQFRNFPHVVYILRVCD